MTAQGDADRSAGARHNANREIGVTGGDDLARQALTGGNA